MAAAEAEAADRDDVDFVPTAIALAPNGYADVLPDPRSGVDERVRRIDGLHLCPDGTERVADLLLERLERLVALAISDEWRVGPWRTDTPFDLSRGVPRTSTERDRRRHGGLAVATGGISAMRFTASR